MAFKISIPFYAFRLHLHAGGSVLAALSDKQVLRIGESLPVFAGKYAELLQRKILNKGKYRQLLEEYREGSFFQDSISVSFPAAKDGFSYPAFQLEFDLFFNQRTEGFWGVIPSLGIERYSKDYPKLLKRLEDAIRLDFTRKHRLQAIQNVVSAIWFEASELNQIEIDLQTPSLQELEEQAEEKEEELLPQVAKPLEMHKRVIYGRESELEQVARILKGRFHRNILLVGPSGVGKTALIWELARQMKKRKIKGLIWETTASVLIKELMRDTGWQDNFARLCRELASLHHFLFVRNLMELFEVGKSEGNDVSMADFLRSYLSRGEVRLLSECTEEELAQIQLKSPNYLNFFQIIRLEEPKENLEDIILKKVKDIASVQNLQINAEAIREVIRLNKRYTPYAGLPGKPIRFLETILLQQKKNNKTSLDRGAIIRHFCEETGLPLFMVDPSLPMYPNKIKDYFNEQVFGQTKAVAGVVDMLASVKMALTRAGKPIASFLFVGPTGVGKTELAKVLAGFMFGNRERMVRFDMSEYSSPYAVLRLLGADYFNDGLLTSAVRRDPFCVLLFDEIEKAHPNFFDLLLQILSEGRLTDSSGKLVNFCSAIIIMTSNIGAGYLKNKPIGWKQGQSASDIGDHFTSAVQKHFRPELVNRIDQIIAFEPLSRDTMRHIVGREINRLKAREGVRFRKMDLHIKPEVYDFLAQEGYHRNFGARHLQRTIRDQLIAPLAKSLNANDQDDQLIVSLSLSDGKISVDVQADPMGLDLLLEELEKIGNANHVSQLRRNIIRLQESHLYIRLLSELDILEHRKKGQKQKFWENQAQVKYYTNLLAARQRIQETRSVIEEMEIDLNLSYLELSDYKTAILERIKQWENGFLQLKKDLLGLMEPSYNRCQFAIYGQNILPILRFYLSLFKQKKYEIKAKAVWFHDAYYQEMLSYNLSKDKEEPSQCLYLKTELSLQEPIHFQEPEEAEKGGLLCGLEFTLSGPNAYLFLLPEMGFQKWKVDSAKENVYHLCIDASPSFITPERIHRREYYANKARRTVGAASIKDVGYFINRELKFSDWLGVLLKHLEENFELLLEKKVY